MLGTQGLPFLDHYDSPGRAFHSLMTERMSNGNFGKPNVMVPGNPDSPHWRDSAIGHLIMDDHRSVMRTAPVLDKG